jgi:N-methylhydantoinase A
VAELLQSVSVIIPPQSSVLSAFGTLVTPVRLDLVRSDLTPIDVIDWNRVDRILDELEREGLAALGEAGCAAADVTVLVGADMRYVGQQHEVTVTFETDPRRTHDAAALIASFETAYRGLYGVNPNHVSVEIVTWRVTARGPLVEARRATLGADRPGQPKAHRAVSAWADAQRVAVWERKGLAVGQTVTGPAIIEERETTTAIPPGWTATIDPVGCIVASKN